MLNLKLISWISVLYVAFYSFLGLANDFESKLIQATALFDQGKNEDAIRIYEDVLANGHINGHVYYNLGIAYYRQQRLGDAVAAFLAAKRYLPRDPDVTANLRFSLSRIQDQLGVEVPSGLSAKFVNAFTGPFSERELALATTILVSLASLGLALSYSAARFRSLRLVAWIGYVLPMISGLLLFLKLTYVETWGAVTAGSAKVFSGPNTSNTVLFEIHNGAPVLATGYDGANFVRIELSDGKKGWIAAQDIRIFTPM